MVDFDPSFRYRSELAEEKVGRYSLRIYENTKVEMDNNDSCVGT